MKRFFFYIKIGYTIGHNMPDMTGVGKWKEYFVKLG